jgi:hypothetical protein
MVGQSTITYGYINASGSNGGFNGQTLGLRDETAKSFASLASGKIVASNYLTKTYDTSAVNVGFVSVFNPATGKVDQSFQGPNTVGKRMFHP